MPGALDQTIFPNGLNKIMLNLDEKTFSTGFIFENEIHFLLNNTNELFIHKLQYISPS